MTTKRFGVTAAGLVLAAALFSPIGNAAAGLTFEGDTSGARQVAAAPARPAPVPSPTEPYFDPVLESDVVGVRPTAEPKYKQYAFGSRAELERTRRNHTQALQGNATAMRDLGFAYERGWGVLRDYVQAHYWFTLAAENGLQSALTNRDNLEKKMSDTQIAKAEALEEGARPQQ